MGMIHSQASVPEDNVEDDPDYCAAERSDHFENSSNMALDAIFAENENKSMPSDIAKLTRKRIDNIKPYLDVQDKVSLTYLLYDDVLAATGLQYTMQLVSGVELDVLDEWINYVSENTWQLKLLESLSIIQHYQALRKLGYIKQTIDDRFLPTNKHTSVYILKKKKKLYRMLETFESDKMNLFLETVHRDFKLKGLEFKRFHYLEMYLMYWTSIKYISSENLDNISKALKVMEMYNEAEEFKETNQVKEDIMLPESEVAMSNLGRNWGRSLSVASTSATSCSMQEDKIVENSYPINPNLPGICLIINQENFYPEFDTNYKHLVPRTDQKLEARTGTEVDNNRLVKTFKKCNYQIIEKKDLTHFDMKTVIESTVESVRNHSSLIICILSHGLEGKVFGVNSIPIAIDSIKEIMCTKNKKNLKGKPKVLILQSCQGSHCQEADEPTYALDGPVSTTDLLVFYATIPGFAAIRDKKKGTWFIQSLCDKIEHESRDSHFDDICTLVQGEVSNKKWERETSNLIMVPMKTSTLTKFFFLPRQ